MRINKHVEVCCQWAARRGSTAERCIAGLSLLELVGYACVSRPSAWCLLTVRRENRCWIEREIAESRALVKMAEGRESRVYSTKTLYELSVAAIADKFFITKKYLDDLPEKILFDIYYQVNPCVSRPSVVIVAQSGGGRVTDREGNIQWTSHTFDDDKKRNNAVFAFVRSVGRSLCFIDASGSIISRPYASR